MAPLMSLLSENVALWTDGGGKTVTAALRPIHGRDAVARISLAAKRFWPENYSVEQKEVNGQAALVLCTDEQAWAVMAIEVEQGQIRRSASSPTPTSSHRSNVPSPPNPSPAPGRGGSPQRRG